MRIFLEEFQDNKKYLMIDHIIFMIRRILLSILIIFVWGNGLIQVCIFIIICALVLISKFIFRPFKSLILNIQSFIFEFILLVILWFFASFSDKSTELSDESGAYSRGVICFILVCSLMLTSFIFTCIQLSIYCYRQQNRNSKDSTNFVPKLDNNIAMKQISEGNKIYIILEIQNFDSCFFI